jgi:myo-inositol-1(or 4)-monophosphatase
MISDTRELDLAKSIALEAGQQLLDYFNKSLTYKKKSDQSLVCEADLASNELIVDRLKKHYPAYGIYSEESNAEYEFNPEGTWIIDPLDGTHNFLRQIPLYGISLALEKNGKLQCGVIYLPEQNKLFYAARGLGAFCNNERIQVSVRDQGHALLHYEGLATTETQWSTFKKLHHDFELRILYSTAYSLSLLASGKIEACYSEADHYFDFAAGAVLVEEAGGAISSLSGSAIDASRGFIASNGLLHQTLLTYF